MRFTIAATAALVATVSATYGHYKDEEKIPSYGQDDHEGGEYETTEIAYPTEPPSYTSPTAQPVYETSSVEATPTPYVPEPYTTAEPVQDTSSAVEPTPYPTAEPTTAYVTETVSDYVTYCPSATEVTHSGVTYTVTEPTTLTITDGCPCTITKPVEASSTEVVPTTLQTYPVEASSTPVAADSTSAPVAGYPTEAAPYTPVPTYPAGNATAPVVPSPTASLPVQYTGAAGKTTFSVAAVFALAALAL